MRLVIISDTHLRNPRKYPRGDILIHCGDALSLGTKNELQTFARNFGELDYKTKIFVPGNHDRIFESDWNYCVRTLHNENRRGLVFPFHDDAMELSGIKFYGSPYQPAFYNWSFNLPRDGKELKEKWDEIPDDTQVLITHGPPHGILDQINIAGENLGCKLLRKRVSERLPDLKLHCFGHIHGSYGREEIEPITFINASICNENYDPVNAPQIFDI